MNLSVARAKWCRYGAVMNITVKDVPPALHERLREAADRSGRSLNKMILFTLERALTPQRTDRQRLMSRIRERRASMPSLLDDEFLAAAIREGRE
tara:strand:- start:105 stop:389 length:285 start_codon:yes stop_codon:yes gene_type:complete